MEIILLKRDVLFMFVQVSVFCNFCNGYIQLCQDSNIGSPNGTTVTAEIGKPAWVLFCVTSDRAVYDYGRVSHPSHRSDSWIRIKEKPDKFVSKFNITNKINITIDNVQSNDLNVSFSVKVYTEINNGSIDYNDFILLTFILHKQNRMKIQSFTITYTKLSIGGDAEMRCSVINSSSPYVLTLTDDTNLTIAGPTGSALIHKITNVQCSDIGTYFCRGETPNGHIEEREDLRVYRCPIQVCRGEDESKVIPAVVGQRLNIPVCVMSESNPWRYRGQNKDVSVHFTRRSQFSGIYFTAHIIFHNVTERHHGNHIIMMENAYGSLNYTITIILQTTRTTTTTATSANKTVPATTSQTLPAQESPAHNPSDTDSKIRDIGLTAGIVLVATALIAFLIHCYRMKSLRRSRQLVTESKPEGRSSHNEMSLLPLARDQTEHISGSGQENISGEQPARSAELNSPYTHYEEIRDVGTNSLESSDVPAHRAFSDIQREEVDFEITVQKNFIDDNHTPYVELVDHHPRTPAASVSSADKGMSQCYSVVEYENTLPVL